ncbi:bifunctional diguanylate cyclase/phosphodiesterase [Tsuneonella sp. YG55]|uniref:Bifunctional diguanylate cyclase/phosphodiesterase n=1 Tax=Tsuneonella litorea TaxID=2976475 RepID=A0A9X2W089_9SPHN|nr:bifunctional diguanylate cyclase/phosphodiesterase [Tsuneonella litorea]MCT2558223.1 bifunctional diguanylate cyclase/phosphodiesterase [Tsuneonella litorea]
MASFPHSTHALDGHDALTGLADAAALERRLADWQDQGLAGGQVAPVHALLVGLGRFDAVNLAYGEAAGDGALVELARRLLHFAADELADGDWLAARLGGGKFALVARQPVSRERWQWLGEALGEAFAAPIAAIDGSGTVRLWPRIALVRILPGETPAHVLDRLAATLGRAHDRPDARVLWADRSHAPAGIRAAELEADLLAALDREEIEIAFQPQYALDDGRIVGAEALARWQHPRVGLIGAGPLFAIAERADHVAHLSRHIAEAALAAAGGWPGHLRLSLNVTPADLASKGFARDFAALVSAAGFDPQRITLEITEQVLLADLDEAAPTIAALRGQGMRIALDDFGGGFCNFRYLKLLALDAIKLDRSMVEGIERDPRDRAVLRAIVALARALDLSVVAEGIETEEQAAIAREEGCALYQGYLGSPPLAPDAFLAHATG